MIIDRYAFVLFTSMIIYLKLYDGFSFIPQGNFKGIGLFIQRIILCQSPDLLFLVFFELVLDIFFKVTLA